VTKRKKEIKSLKTGAISRGFSLAKLGLHAGAKAATHAVGNIFGDEAAQSLRKKALLLEQMALISEELSQLKGSLMKAGQMLSVYGEHFLPAEANQLLKLLQSDSPPLQWPEIRKALTRQLGKEKLGQLEITEAPEAAASLGQVHRAKILATGEEIVLKVQYPGVDRAIDGDIRTLRRVLSLMDWLPKLPATDDLFAEVKSMLKQELDYEVELRHLQFFRKALAGDPTYILPGPFPEFSGKRVLAMSYEPGAPLDGPEVAALSQPRRNVLAVAALELYFRELFVWHKVQTDAHFGNYRVRLGTSGEADRWVLYDYGAVREVGAPFMEKYRRMLREFFAPTGPPSNGPPKTSACSARTIPPSSEISFLSSVPRSWNPSPSTSPTTGRITNSRSARVN
jgi:predicted unusual protein kinase regulating ubiquinone biosynthesis (AarF/ABC1/UbiB family)